MASDAREAVKLGGSTSKASGRVLSKDNIRIEERYEAPPPSPDKSVRRYLGRKVTWRSAIYLTLDDPSFSRVAALYCCFMLSVIVLVTTTYVLESETSIEDGTLYGTNALPIFQWIEFIAVILFTVEYLLRLATFPINKQHGCIGGTFRYVFGPLNVIDAVACFPYWYTYYMRVVNPTIDQSGLGFVRVIRLIRVFRIFRIGKYSTGIQMFAAAMTRSANPLSILILMLGIAILLISSIMYIVEGSIQGPNSTSGVDPEALAGMARPHEVHLACYGTIPRCFWWAMVTMTTVGYGDCFPVSALGKLIGGITMLTGVLILALPITVVGSNFSQVVEMYEADRQALKETGIADLDGDGVIDDLELREFLVAKRKVNALRLDIQTHPEALMSRFDVDKKGHLYPDEFMQLQEYVIEKKDPLEMTKKLVTASEENDKRLADMKDSIRQMDARFEAGMAKMERMLLTIAAQLEKSSSHSPGVTPRRQAKLTTGSPTDSAKGEQPGPEDGPRLSGLPAGGQKLLKPKDSFARAPREYRPPGARPEVLKPMATPKCEPVAASPRAMNSVTSFKI